MAKKSDAITACTQKEFETKYERVKEITAILDEGKKPIGEMIALYEEGLRLAQECKEFLSLAEGKVIDITNKYTNTSGMAIDIAEDLED